MKARIQLNETYKFIVPENENLKHDTRNCPDSYIFTKDKEEVVSMDFKKGKERKTVIVIDEGNLSFKGKDFDRGFTLKFPEIDSRMIYNPYVQEYKKLSEERHRISVRSAGAAYFFSDKDALMPHTCHYEIAE